MEKGREMKEKERNIDFAGAGLSELKHSIP